MSSNAFRWFPFFIRTPLLRRLLIFLLLSTSIRAQQSAGYAFLAPGTTAGRGIKGTFQGGLGGELVWRYFGLGSELSYLAPMEAFSNAAGVFSLDPTAHFPWHHRSTIDPYALAGYTVIFGDHVASGGGSYGGGVNWWFDPDYGLKLEFRDQVVHGIHYWGFRVGLNFRTE